ncbi:helicase-associated domain-containing protein [Streptomyces sp. NPDC050560]|uniref:helicase-associated domain-containing protein n=1 Tax=Streptomyces sp. NPDC050560 TaxID=3365630 RepID=UPI0037AD9EBB
MSSHLTSGGGAPRSLAEALRARDDASLAALLRARPDLLSPVPLDMTQLATRAVNRASVVRALGRLDRFALQTAQALAIAAEPTPYRALRELLTGYGADGDSGPDSAADTGHPREREEDETVAPGAASASATAPATPDTTASGTTATESNADPGGGPERLPLSGAVARALPGAVGTLREQALLWGPDDRLRLVRTARELLTPSPQHPSPTGLGPTVAEATSGMSPGRVQEIVTTAGLPTTHDAVSAVSALAALFADRSRMAALLDEAPPAALDVLERLLWGPPYGQVTAAPAPHLRWLLDRGLLLPTSPGTVVLPREAALHLRGGRAHRRLEPLPPTIATAAHNRPRIVDMTAAGQAYTAVTVVEGLLKEWDEGGPAVLRAGGLSVRDLKRTATALDAPETTAAFWLELAYAAGLLASDGGHGTFAAAEGDDPEAALADDPAEGGRSRRRDVERYAATPAYDTWLDLPVAERWQRLVTAWLPATRTPGLVGGRDSKDRALSALGPGLDRSASPEVRGRVLALLDELPEGAAPDPDALLARLGWERPARAERPEGLRSRIARWVLDEAELLGVTGRGALSTHGRALLATGAREQGQAPGQEQAREHGPVQGPSPAELLAPLLPEPVDHVLLQADLTAVAPGPLVAPVAETLGVLADVESKGGATVYRFTPGSVRRALDSGHGADDLHAFLATHSRTPVPQPLSYLIDDVARKHGHLRIGAASAYVRCDDPAVLDEITADKRSAGLGLRRLAPTVIATRTEPAPLLDGLRAMGFAPAIESATGDVVVARASALRTPERTAPEPVPDGPPEPDTAVLADAVRALRTGEAAASAPRGDVPQPPGQVPRTPTEDTLAALQAAVLTGEAVWIGYVNAEGTASRRVIAPVRVEGGVVTAFDRIADELRTYPLHRITGITGITELSHDT